jgi:hypothetical protein
MATQVESFYFEASARTHRLGVVRLALAGGLSAALVFILCWLGTLVPFGSPTHAYIALFTPAPIQSVQALGEGSLWSLLFGILVGAVFALVYNLLAVVERQ